MIALWVVVIKNEIKLEKIKLYGLTVHLFTLVNLINKIIKLSGEYFKFKCS